MPVPQSLKYRKPNFSHVSVHSYFVFLAKCGWFTSYSTNLTISLMPKLMVEILVVGI